MRAALFTPGDDVVRLVTVPDGDRLHWFQQQVGGWIEHVDVEHLEADDDVCIGFYINEEGKLDGLPLNPWATRLWFGLDVEDQPYPFPLPDVLVGPAVLTATDMRTGEACDLPESVLQRVRELGYPITEEARA